MMSSTPAPKRGAAGHLKRLAAVAVLILAVVNVSPDPLGASVPGKGFTETGCDGYSDSVARLYTAGLDREPEQGGFEFWMTEYTAGRYDLPRMATFFTQSPEFEASYGSLTQDGFIRQLYRNVLGREGEQGGVTFWNGEMSAGMDRGTVLLRFAESMENITNSGTVEPTLGPFNDGLQGPWTCTTAIPPSSSRWDDNCRFDGVPMWGNVYVTPYEFNADFTVYLTDYDFAADLTVYVTDYDFSAYSCGRWYLTDFEFAADFTIYITDFEFAADFTVYETNLDFVAGR